jgi:hypothetical protein
MEHLNGLVRKTLATFRQDEVAFVYIPKERINADIFTRRFGPGQEADENGVTYSLTRADLVTCFSAQKPSVKKINWIVCIPPIAARVITSVAVPMSDSPSKTSDLVIALNAPAFAACTIGTTVVHFIQDNEADAFIQRLQMAD